jgi:hypothetical protein
MTPVYVYAYGPKIETYVFLPQPGTGKETSRLSFVNC